jgi:hypothetical protein
LGEYNSDNLKKILYLSWSEGRTTFKELPIFSKGSFYMAFLISFVSGHPSPGCHRVYYFLQTPLGENWFHLCIEHMFFYSKETEENLPILTLSHCMKCT